ncbi:MAG: serine hydroxymethyltransferase [Candidatus Dependentiae bacterium]|nr:serine hydroxymethyltransferase [Candidatus Dependentiae bacterium]
MEDIYKKNQKSFSYLPDQQEDAELFSLIAQELHRQEREINLIASENYVSQAVLKATGSVLTNKYAEGYPGKRYYAGCSIVDTVEQLAIDRCKTLFGAEHVNVQSHAGSQANMSVYHALLVPGDTILGMSLASGGHLTHGHTVNFSGKLFNSIQYGVNHITERLDYHEIRRLAHEHKPKLIIAGASAYSRTIDFECFADIAQEVGAYLMADIAHIAGLVATNLHPTPIGYADFVTSTTHKTLRGPRGGLIMCKKEHAQAVDRAIMPGTQGGPFMQVIAAKAVAFYEASQSQFTIYQLQIIKNAQAMAATFQHLGYRIVAGGTDNHLFVLDLRSKQINGHEAQIALEKAGIMVSKSCIPFDPEKPWITSGIRIGTPAITTRGMHEQQAIEIAHWIDEVITQHKNESVLRAIKQHIVRMCTEFSVY